MIFWGMSILIFGMLLACASLILICALPLSFLPTHGFLFESKSFGLFFSLSPALLFMLDFLLMDLAPSFLGTLAKIVHSFFTKCDEEGAVIV